MGPQPAAEKTEHGLRGRVVEKKVDEMKGYVERLKSLVSEYVPPQREKIQEVVQAGKASKASLNTSSGGTTRIVLSNYYIWFCLLSLTTERDLMPFSDRSRASLSAH